MQAISSMILILGAACLPLSASVDGSYSALDSRGIPLDWKLIERMGTAKGTFVEVGANDGVEQSNTKLLEEKFGWTGVLVEPSKILFDKLVKNRPNSTCFQCALGSFEQNNTFLYGDFDGHPMSSIDGKRIGRSAEYRVPVRSLQSILDEAGYEHIHFFSLDVEGYELNVLKGIDFSKTSFDFILIEIYNRFFREIIDFMHNKGYDLIENLSNYNSSENSNWDGTHNDYLFRSIKYPNSSSGKPSTLDSRPSPAPILNPADPDVYLSGRIPSSNGRYSTFRSALKLMQERSVQTIVETGTERWQVASNSFDGDGGATIIFSHWASDHGAKMYSVDVNETHVMYSRENTSLYAKNLEIVCDDSVSFLKRFPTPIDLLYLDSYDYSEKNPRPAQEHCLNEVLAAEDKLRDTSIVMIDDCNIPGGGKGLLAIQYLLSKGWRYYQNRHQVILVFPARKNS